LEQLALKRLREDKGLLYTVPFLPFFDEVIGTFDNGFQRILWRR
jgi:hypothetical protein